MAIFILHFVQNISILVNITLFIGKLFSINDWLTALNKYMAIYGIKHPHEQAKLAKHLEAGHCRFKS